MKIKCYQFLLVLVCTMVLTACSNNTNNVPSLAATPMPNAVNEESNDEALVMEFADCLRNEGMQVTDPTIDSEGNIQMPELVENATATKDEWIAAYEVCGEIIENITFAKKEVDRSAQLEQYLEVAACMNEAGFDVGEPTTETLDTWMIDLKENFDWDDPDTEEIFDTCFGGSSDGESKGEGGK